MQCYSQSPGLKDYRVHREWLALMGLKGQLVRRELLEKQELQALLDPLDLRVFRASLEQTGTTRFCRYLKLETQRHKIQPTLLLRNGSTCLRLTL